MKTVEYVQHHLPSLHSDYHILQNVSMLARYQSVADFYKQFQPEDVEQEIVNNRLARIEAYVQT